MSSLKKIIINPELFNTGTKTKKNINRSSNQQIHTIKPNLLKKHLINKIKEHKKISNNSSNNTILGESDKFTNEYNEILLQIKLLKIIAQIIQIQIYHMVVVVIIIIIII